MKQFTIENVFLALPRQIRKGIRLLKLNKRQLATRVMFGDFLSVASSIGFVIFPAFLAGLIFVWLDQGRDTLLLVIENLIEFNFIPLVCLMAATTFYSVTAELSVRYAIYISDNSGKNLVVARTFFRLNCQKALAAFFLLWPFIFIICGFALCISRATYLEPFQIAISFASCIVTTILMMMIVSFLYFHKFGKAKAYVPLKTFCGERSLDKKEQNWIRKLYGIYDDYIYSLPKASNFQGLFKTLLGSFNSLITTPINLSIFLQSKTIMAKGRELDASFALQAPATIVIPKGNSLKWVYSIPNVFYLTLHRQVKKIVFASIALLLMISFIDPSWGVYQQIGAPALVCSAFGCYCGLYTGLLFLDKAILRTWKVSVRFILLIALVVVSFINNDHPVTMRNKPVTNRTLVVNQFNKWFTNYKKLVNAANNLDTSSKRKYPVIFICAEGGAFRTGAYTGIYLTRLEDTLQTMQIGFRNSVFAMSGVSGGAVGLGIYNALAYRSNQGSSVLNAEAATRFFENDALSPIIGKMFFGEFLNLLIPWNIELFSRAVALEKTWETAYAHAIGKNDNVFKSAFVQANERPYAPLFIANTAEVESGLQCWTSNFEPDSIILKPQRDLFYKKIGQIKYSTAINFSTRFPLFSPGGAVEVGETKYHYLDGGYVENQGTSSMLETLSLLKKKSAAFEQVIPVMIYLKFSDEASDPVKDINFGNELSEIILGIYNTRSGRTTTSRMQLESFVRNHNHGVNISQPLESKSVPMNWALSDQSLKNINSDISKKLKSNYSTAVIPLLKNFKSSFPKK